MNAPSLADFLNALLTIEEFLVAKLEELKARFPEEAANLEKLAEYLKVNGRTLEVLNLVYKELEVLESGLGPIDPAGVDLA